MVGISGPENQDFKTLIGLPPWLLVGVISLEKRRFEAVYVADSITYSNVASI